MALYFCQREMQEKWYFLGRPGIRFEASKIITKGAKISQKNRENQRTKK
jgi:hypothetical protein